MISPAPQNYGYHAAAPKDTLPHFKSKHHMTIKLIIKNS